MTDELFTADADPAGQQWIAAFPTLVDRLRNEWSLDIDDTPPTRGYNAFVLAARRGSEPCVLKLTWPAERAVVEARALNAWDGRGAVKLLAARPEDGALLLERLDANRSLANVDLLDAAETAGRLLHRLAIPALAGFRKSSAIANEIADALPDQQARLHNPVPKVWLDAACALARELAIDIGDRLVHTDLHYGNVLAGRRESWLAIDPKPVEGDPEHAIPELLWTRVDETTSDNDFGRLFDVLVRSAELDAERARAWAIVRCVDYWLWGLANGLTDDPERCRRVLEALA